MFLFRWFLRLFRPAAPDHRFGVFAYAINGLPRYADAMEAESKLAVATGYRWPECLTDLQRFGSEPQPATDGTTAAPDPVKRAEQLRAALDAAVRCARAAFDLPPVAADGSGVGDADAVAVLVEFYAFSHAFATHSDNPLNKIARLVESGRFYAMMPY
ncbi:hypothetical protein [Limnoglobus roseus]|uniref:Uncharacterized protein n=1 Tax=Limnoglobus roseus TaxID=2598579 RepID=A0A5C1ADV1_9BACT|nr:hypothetical protein [Limnoglobus roseus]QEL15882.1 hypothetical protein PX52LOC_02818 [Limnoglobus roseus]